MASAKKIPAAAVKKGTAAAKKRSAAAKKVAAAAAKKRASSLIPLSEVVAQVADLQLRIEKLLQLLLAARSASTGTHTSIYDADPLVVRTAR